MSVEKSRKMENYSKAPNNFTDPEILFKEAKEKGVENIEVYDTDESPIKIRGNKEKGYAATLGKHRLTDWKETAQDCLDWMQDNPYQMMMVIAGTIVVDAAEHGAEGHRINGEKHYDDFIKPELKEIND